LIRSRKRHQEHRPPAEEEGDAMLDIPATAPGPDRIAYSAQVEERISGAMAELSEQERSAFVLRHFEGFSIDEIATTLGLGASAAKHSIFRAVQKLRKALEPVVSSL